MVFSPTWDRVGKGQGKERQRILSFLLWSILGLRNLFLQPHDCSRPIKAEGSDQEGEKLVFLAERDRTGAVYTILRGFFPTCFYSGLSSYKKGPGGLQAPSATGDLVQQLPRLLKFQATLPTRFQSISAVIHG